MKYAILALTLLLGFYSCGVEERKFDTSEWNKRDDMFYANRESMVSDLMENHLWRGMTYNELTNLIGKPEHYADMPPNTIGYEIMVDYGFDIDPVEGKKLIIVLSSDSTIADFRLEHWKR